MVVHHVSRLFSMLVFHFFLIFRAFPFPCCIMFCVSSVFPLSSFLFCSTLFVAFSIFFPFVFLSERCHVFSCCPPFSFGLFQPFFPFSWCVGPLARRRVDAFCVEFARGKFMSGKKEQTRKGTAAPAVGGETPQAGGPSSSWWSGGGGVGDRWHESGRSSWWWSDAGGGGDPRKPHQRQSAST